MSILWILIPAPLVGYLVAEWCRTAFSDDPRLVRRLMADQPVTMLAAVTIVGAAVLWVVLEAIRRLFLA